MTALMAVPNALGLAAVLDKGGVAFDPEGDDALRLVPLGTGTVRVSVNGGAPIEVGPEGRWIAVAPDGLVRLVATAEMHETLFILPETGEAGAALSVRPIPSFRHDLEAPSFEAIGCLLAWALVSFCNRPRAT